jgi:hypothetical protein
VQDGPKIIMLWVMKYSRPIRWKEKGKNQKMGAGAETARGSSFLRMSDIFNNRSYWKNLVKTRLGNLK